jgi:glycosyltransferase 2 family protein
MATTIKTADFSWVFLSIFFSILAHLSRAQRWNMLISPLGYNPSLKNSFAALMTGYLANLALPRMGEISRCAALAQAEKAPMDSLIGTVITERLLDLIMLVICIVLATVLNFNTVGGIVMQQLIIPAGTKFFSLLTSWLFYAVIIGIIAAVVFYKKSKTKKELPVIKKVVLFLKGMGTGMKSVFLMKNKGWFLFHTIFIWIMYFLTTYVCFRAIDETSSLSLMAGLFVLVGGSLGMTAPVQGGIGVYHLLVAKALTFYAIPFTVGLIYATIVHSSQVLMVLITGGFSVLYFSLRKNKING